MLMSSCSIFRPIKISKIDVNSTLSNGCIEIKTNKSSDEWTKFCDPISNFNYQEGFIYKIEIEEIKSNKNDSKITKYKVVFLTYAPITSRCDDFKGKFGVGCLGGVKYVLNKLGICDNQEANYLN